MGGSLLLCLETCGGWPAWQCWSINWWKSENPINVYQAGSSAWWWLIRTQNCVCGGEEGWRGLNPSHYSPVFLSGVLGTGEGLFMQQVLNKTSMLPSFDGFNGVEFLNSRCPLGSQAEPDPCHPPTHLPPTLNRHTHIKILYVSLPDNSPKVHFSVCVSKQLWLTRLSLTGLYSHPFNFSEVETLLSWESCCNYSFCWGFYLYVTWSFTVSLKRMSSNHFLSAVLFA